MINEFMEATVQFKKVYHQTIRLKRPLCISLQKHGRTIYQGNFRCGMIEVYS